MLKTFTHLPEIFLRKAVALRTFATLQPKAPRKITARAARSDGRRPCTKQTRDQQTKSAIERFAALRTAADKLSVCTGANSKQDNLSLLPLFRSETNARQLYRLLVPPDTEPRRIRHHVNPYKPALIQPAAEVAWAEVFQDPTRPLIVDIGCASGRFLLAVASKLPHHNLLGLDIRSPLIDRARDWAATLGIASCTSFQICNATVNYERLLRNYPGPIVMTFIQCPDPHFKTRHHKRRIVQPRLATSIADLTAPGGLVYLSSDVLEVSINMREIFEAHAGHVLQLAPDHPQMLAPPSSDTAFTKRSLPTEVSASEASNHMERQAVATVLPHVCVNQQNAPQRPRLQQAHASYEDRTLTPWERYDWLPGNPLGLPTERELSVLSHGDPMFRMLLHKPVAARLSTGIVEPVW